LVGYHCTKLTRDEISGISKSGMSLQNGKTLTSRIEMLESEGILTKEVAEDLKINNQCNAVIV
jgi:DNA-binding HxlR family transcriptional regulator